MKFTRDHLVLACALAALGLLMAAGFYTRNMLNLTEWPRVNGLVLKSSVVNLGDDNFQGQFRVRYRAGNKDHEKLLTSPITTDSLSVAQATIADYPAGKPFQLPLNPNNAGDIRLLPGPGDWILVLALGGGGLLFLLIPVVVVALSKPEDTVRLVGFNFSAVGLLLVGFGLILGWSKISLLRNCPTVQATVVSSQVESDGQRFWLGLELAYQVDSRDYRVGSASFWRTTSSQRAENQLRLWLPGSKHWLRYRPATPEVISFDTGWTLGNFFPIGVLLGVGASTCLIGILIVRFLGTPGAP